MKKLFILTVLMVFIFSAAVYGAESERYIDAEEAGRSKVAIEGMEGCYIMADSAGSYVNIVDADGNKLTDRAFKAVYNKMEYLGYIRVRYYNSWDLSGFAVLNKDFEEVVPERHYQKISSETVIGNSYFVGDKRDEEGTLTADYYWLGYNYEFDGLKDVYAPDGELTYVSSFAEDRIEAARESGLILDNMKYNYFDHEITRYDMACLALQVVLDKYNTNIYSYITENNISLNYGKYLDVVSPNILLAEEMGLIAPTEGKYFNPDEAITRQEAAYILNRLCEIFGVETTARETAFDDEGDIAEWAKEAVYNVSGTRTDDTYVLAETAGNKFHPNETDYSLERAVMAVWRIVNWGNIDFSQYESSFDKKDIGCDLYVYQNTDGKWGVSGDGFSVDAFYELPVNYDYFYALNGYFTLALYDAQSYSHKVRGKIREDNTYFVFNGSGELIKTLTYGIDDVKSEKPRDLDFVEISPISVYGTNIVFGGLTEEDKNIKNGYATYKQYIKRLVSEKIAGEGYKAIVPYEDAGFLATEEATGKRCILDLEGNFVEYYTGTEEE